MMNLLPQEKFENTRIVLTTGSCTRWDIPNLLVDGKISVSVRTWSGAG